MYPGYLADVSREGMDALHCLWKLAAANLRRGIAASPLVIVIPDDTMWFCSRFGLVCI